jgi:hypothetical protein
MTQPKCLITGCDLALPFQYAHGDLHEFGDVYIFNTVLTDGETRWESGKPSAVHKVLHIAAETPLFVRRGVIILQKADAMLSQTAQEYLA